MIIVFYENDSDSMCVLINSTFPDLNYSSQSLPQMLNHAILALKNTFVDEMNRNIEASEQGIMEEFLNSLTTNDLPPNELPLKHNCSIMLLRNLDPLEGLCNGTCLISQTFTRNLIDVEISIGDHAGKRIFTPRIPFLPNSNEYTKFPFKRTQFSMTIK